MTLQVASAEGVFSAQQAMQSVSPFTAVLDSGRSDSSEVWHTCHWLAWEVTTG
jgi:hypothetical protein